MLRNVVAANEGAASVDILRGCLLAKEGGDGGVLKSNFSARLRYLWILKMKLLLLLERH